VYMTGGCNLACQHCWIAPTYQANGGTGGHLDYDLFAIAIEEGLPLGLYNIKLTGGEPLLHPDFVRFVDLIKEKELGLTIETNGTLMTESLARYLKEKSTLSHISVSLDGATAATHDPFRGVKGSFDKAVQGIRFLVEVGFHPQIIMSLHAGNINEIEALVALATELGAGSVKFNLIQATGRGETFVWRGKSLALPQQIELGRWIEDDLQKHSSIELHYSWPPVFNSLKKLVSGVIGSCSVFNILGILNTGHLALCGIGEQIPELNFGLLGDDRVADIWTNHPTLLDIRKNVPDNLEGVCSLCIFQQRCFGHCIAENYHYYKRLTAPFWFCQEAENVGLFPTTRKSR